MIEEIDEALAGSLRKGLAGLVPGENIVAGQTERTKSGVSIANIDFTIEESGMQVSEVRNEEAEETFDATGQSAEFVLKGQPVNEILQVEYPRGTFRAAPDDYAFDRAFNAVVFRDPPKKGKGAVRIKYELAKPLGESRILKFVLTYAIVISTADVKERDRITLAAIETLYRDVDNLFRQGVGDIRFNRGYTVDAADGPVKSSVLEYTVTASRRIDITYPAIEKVEIKKSKI
jgi:hypothetical protein